MFWFGLMGVGFFPQKKGFHCKTPDVTVVIQGGKKVLYMSILESVCLGIAITALLLQNCVA